MMSKGKLKQILLLTDGCSNEGTDPVAVASLASEYGITVNVVGILDDRSLSDQGMEEVQNIARAGNGVHQLVYSHNLPKTVQMVTRKAMNQTIQHVVNQELKHILGEQEEMDALPPERRGQVVEVVENLGETLALDVLILVDTSASMKHKMASVSQALRDLSISLQSRAGENRFSLWTFPGMRDSAELKMDWSTEFTSLDQWLASLSPKGTTPTGPALEEALRYFAGGDVWSDQEGLLEDNAL